MFEILTILPLLGCIVFVTSCLTGQTSGTRRGDVILDVPFVRQKPDGCLYAGVASLISFHSGNPDARGIVRCLESLSSSEEMSPSAISAVVLLKETGHEATLARASWDSLVDLIDKGIAVMVIVSPERKTAREEAHCMVAIGHNKDRNEIFMHSGHRRMLRMHRADLERAWSTSGFLAIWIDE